MTYLLYTVCFAALGYQLIALVATLLHLARRDPAPTRFPPISILKPIHGLDDNFYQAIRSHAAQDYPEFEILFGVKDGDPAIADIEQVRAEFPHRNIRIVKTTHQSPNGKVAALIDLAKQARHEILLVNDSDIRVPPHYLRRIAAPLESRRIGLVTCLYRATAKTLPGRFEALGIATDFAPSTLVAPLVGVKEFALGSTLLFRASDLQKIGGFPTIQDYLADDYQLAKRITQLGRRVYLSKVVVETGLQGATWSAVWNHQLRWHRTIRLSRGAYAGLPITHATLWSVIAAAAGHWPLAIALLAARIAMALTAGEAVLRDPITARYFFLIPLRDLWGTAIWAAGLTGKTVRWRDQHLRLTPDGRIM